jgi:propanol-preferring alcohol dehydrogenase
MVLRRQAPVAEAPLEAEERPEPRPGEGEVVIRVEACAVCRTDLQIVEGDIELHRSPLVPGHQVVGRVAAVGAGVTEWREGDLAGLDWLAWADGRCRFCRSERENLCEHGAFTGWDRDGGYADFVTADADFAVRPPADRPPEAAAPLLCGGVIGYRSLRVAGVQPGQRLGLYGFGASARLVIQVARHWGCEVHVATRSPAEQERALAMGASSVGGYEDAPPAPLDAAITFAPVGWVVAAALRAVDRGATVAINAIHLDQLPEMSYDDLWWERSLHSVANVTRRDAAEFLALAAEIPITAPYETFALADANEALARAAAGGEAGAAVLLPSP